jgi:poly-gamma-glutamate capsule biosynthesis protein CapA/YwtB (metallophosphatase superfamily)
MKKTILLYILFSLFITGTFAQDTTYLKIIFAGDIMGHDGQIKGAYNDSLKGYDYEPTFRYVKPYVQSADFGIANLEVTLAGPPYKGYPQFSSPDSVAIEAFKAGFNVFLTANNHSLDRGAKGFERTLKVLDSIKAYRTGTFYNEEKRNEEYPLIIDKNNIKVALLNYTYGTNGLTIKPPSIVNMIDTALIRKDLLKARADSVDFTIVTIHWGTEYERNENREQTRLAQFMIKNGADAVIGGHPHVIQPVKVYYPNAADSSRSNLVVYSLGNFVSNQRSRYQDGGIIFDIKLMKTGGSTSVSDHSYLPVWVYRKTVLDKFTFYILPVGLYLENKEYFKLNETDTQKITQFYDDTRDHLKNVKENQFYKDFKLE